MAVFGVLNLSSGRKRISNPKRSTKNSYKRRAKRSDEGGNRSKFDS